MFDAIVVGARCAGASTAMLLARRGYHVLLVDRAKFPSDIPHGHFIHRHGPARLQRWGLLERIVASNCPPLTSFTQDLGDFPLVGKDLHMNGIGFGYGPRRAVLDQILLNAALEAGVEFREGFAVEEFVSNGDQITGVRGRAKQGATTIEHARVTVGADGRNSKLAATVNARKYQDTPPLTCWYFSYWSDVSLDGLEIYVRGERIIFAFPTNDDLSAVFVAFPSDQLQVVRSDIETHFMRVVDRVPLLAERLRGGQRQERFYGATDLPNFMRKPYGPGWALVGDAGCHKDPYMALGICDGLRDAELLADALDDGLSGRCSLDETLADYERQRNAATLPLYQRNIAAAQFQPPPPEIVRLRAALRYNQADTNRFFLAFEELIPPETFFNPENLQQIMTAGAINEPVR